MPAPHTAHTIDTQDSLTSSMASTTLRTVKHVRFASELSFERTPDTSASDPFSDSYKDWSPDAPTSPHHGPSTTRNNSQPRHSSTRHTIPHGSTRRESLEAFDDIKRRWSVESLSEESSAIDEE
ncbi:hypothetical protein M436DRAFT_85502 [Aureobasidium namibiae CBS 147.97]|uniref:Uncharacterized protein n=1 Tax=Aureobasidium namibiae CBS 147.97 TaxID=1043004 RepID=A0A074WHA9_9PEZI